MKIRIYIPVVLTYLISFNARSQEVQKKDHTHDIGFNTNIIVQGIFNSDPAAFSLMYKKYKAENKAVRLGISLNLNLNNNSGTTNNGPISLTSNNINLSLIIGTEKQNSITDRWIWYYGGDLIPRMSINNSEQSNPNASSTSSTKFSSYGLTARPFLGLRFNINPRLYLSTEFSAELRYSHHNSLVMRNDPGGSQRDETQGNNLDLAFIPASSLFLFYRF